MTMKRLFDSTHPFFKDHGAALGRSQNGFTLLELLVAVAIFNIAMLGVFGMGSASIIAGAHANDLSMAKNTARGLLEELALSDFDQIEPDSNTSRLCGQDPGFPCFFNKNGTENTVANEAYFTGSYNCEPSPDPDESVNNPIATTTTLAQCTVDVSWQFNDQSKSITLEGSIFRNR